MHTIAFNRMIDLEQLPIVGRGSHGTVYRLDKNRCIKVCKSEATMQKEYRVLQHAVRFAHFPKVYECKGNYMIREYIGGVNIIDYIKASGFSINLAKKLIELIDIFKELGFTRLDCRFSQLFVTSDHQLKVIDVTRHMDKKRDYPYKIFKGLRRLGYAKRFLNYLKVLRPEYYKEWKRKWKAKLK